ncbi:MAG: hypothetical protein V4674_03875 [Patescibacteria group bacterium]
MSNRVEITLAEAQQRAASVAPDCDFEALPASVEELEAIKEKIVDGFYAKARSIPGYVCNVSAASYGKVAVWKSYPLKVHVFWY